jgi:NTE family protein
LVDFKKRFYHHRGITVIQKRDPSLSRIRSGKVALVLAGGAISGGAFKAGGLRALDEVFSTRKPPGGAQTPFGLNDVDLYIGLSAGSVLAMTLAAGISPDEILRIVMGSSGTYEEFRASEFMRPHPGHMASRTMAMLAHEHELFTNWLSGATDERTVAPYGLRKTLVKMIAALPRALPTGIFSTEGLGAYLRRNMAKVQFPDDFAEAFARTKKGLFLSAVDVNTAKMVIFGHDEPYGKVPISEAIRASCALPGWYQPVRLPNPRAAAGDPDEPPFLDLVDGGLVRTANVRVAVEKGADLVICYNPFSSIRYQRVGRSLVDHGPYALVNQIFRIVLGARLDLAKELIYRDETIDADVVFIEPADDDFKFFRMNPLDHSSKERAAAHGYRSIRASIQQNHSVLAEIFATHGIALHPASGKPADWEGHEILPHELRESRGTSE